MGFLACLFGLIGIIHCVCFANFPSQLMADQTSLNEDLQTGIDFSDEENLHSSTTSNSSSSAPKEGYYQRHGNEEWDTNDTDLMYGNEKQNYFRALAWMFET